MNEKDTIKDLENQAANTRYLMDKLNRAAYGMTLDEIVKRIIDCGKADKDPCLDNDISTDEKSLSSTNKD